MWVYCLRASNDSTIYTYNCVLNCVSDATIYTYNCVINCVSNAVLLLSNKTSSVDHFWSLDFKLLVINAFPW